MTAAFEQAYRTRFSFLMEDKRIVVEAVSVEAAATETPPPAGADPDGCGNEPPITGSLPQPAQCAPTEPGGPASPNPCDSVRLAPGDVFVIETPGGGGFGEELSRTESADSRTPVTAGSGGAPPPPVR
jgi:hypothetical protein